MCKSWCRSGALKSVYDIPEDLQDSSGYSCFLCQVFMQLHNQGNSVLQIRVFGRKNLTLKTLSKFAADNFLNFVLLFFREYKTCHFMCIVCWADESHEISSPIFSEKYKKKKKKKIKMSSAEVAISPLRINICCIRKSCRILSEQIYWDNCHENQHLRGVAD